MAQETIPKYDYYVIYVHGSSTDAQGIFEQFNGELEGMIMEGWQTEGEHQITYMERFSKNLIISQKMKRYSKGYERYQGFSDARYVVME